MNLIAKTFQMKIKNFQEDSNNEKKLNKQLIVLINISLINSNFIYLGITRLFQTVLKTNNLHSFYTFKRMKPTPPQQNPSEFKLQNMTREQLKKIEKSMKKPQFMGLLNEYMIEISDPKNRQQYDQYLRQMESEGQLPKNMKLVELTPHFCIRTSIVSEKNKKHNMKFFINFCGTQHLDQPNCEPAVNQQGKTQFGWKVPNSMGKIRYDQDKSGTPCQVADVAFNSKAFDIIEAENNLPFRKNQFKSMMIAIGLECAQKQLGQRKQTLSKDYDILKNLKCKGGKPALLPLRYIKGKAYNKGEGPQSNTIQRDTEGRETKLQKQINQLKQKNTEEKKKQNQKTKQDEMDEEDDLEDKKVLVQDLESGIQQPKYSSIYTYPVDYSEFLQDPSHLTAKKIPSHFTIEFKLPRIQGMEQIGGDGLNVNENRVVLKIGQKYFIDLPFQTFKIKYKLITQKVKAKFDKKKKLLKLIFPIDLSIKYQEEEQKPQNKVQQIGEQNNEQGQVVQNQTWKNKVLEVTEPTVDLKIIQQNDLKQQPVEPHQKKLIQQIDEDDYEQEAKDQNSRQIQKDPSSFQEALEQQKNNAFSLRKYYELHQQKNQKSTKPQQKLQAPQPQKTLPKPNQLAYVFQETSDKVVLVIKMLNYKKEDLKVVFDQLENNDFFVQWNLNSPSAEEDSAKRYQDPTKIYVLNFKIDQNFVKDIKKVEIFYRVNFLAIFLHKNSLGKFWQKQSITTVNYDGAEGKSPYEQFKTARDDLQRINNERLAYEKVQQQEMKQKQATVVKNNITQQKPQTTTKQTPNQIQSTTTQHQQKTYSIDNEAQKQGAKQQQNTRIGGDYFSFNNLPPQFIKFDIKFVEAFD